MCLDLGEPIIISDHDDLSDSFCESEDSYETDIEGDTPLEQFLYKHKVTNGNLKDIKPNYKFDCIQFLSEKIDDLECLLEEEPLEDDD